ncbi:hypothetical protein TNCV_3653371 [Trichonephila clavipes]|nr:hypothetical protein TNCV_3653371 [Trichonephila clavipes]
MFSSSLHPWFQLRPPTRLSDPLIKQARTPCVLGGYLVTSGIEHRPSGLQSDALTTRLPTAHEYYTKTVNCSRLLQLETPSIRNNGKFNGLELQTGGRMIDSSSGAAVETR